MIIFDLFRGVSVAPENKKSSGQLNTRNAKIFGKSLRSEGKKRNGRTKNNPE